MRFAAAAAAYAAASRPPLPVSPPPHLQAWPDKIEDLLADLFQLQAEVHEHLGGHSFVLAEQAQQDVLRANVVVVEVARLFDRVLDHLLGARACGSLPVVTISGPALDELLDFEANLAEVDVEVLQDVGGDAATLP